MPDPPMTDPKRPVGPPLVSVVMSVFDGEAWLAESVESILAQTERDLELVVVDDGSTDGSGEILAELARRDPRIRLFRNEANQGQAAALNRGLEASGGRYVARMDADDVAEPERLAAQIAWLERRPEVGLLGTAVRRIDDEGRPGALRRRPASDLEIRWACLLESPFMHPTVMLRRAVLEEYGLRYDERLRTAQDYDLWVRLLRRTRAANLPEPLVRYRRPARRSSARRRDQLSNHDEIAWRSIRESVPSFAEIERETVTGLRALFVGGSDVTPVAEEERLALCRLYLDLAGAFLRQHRGELDTAAVRESSTARAARVLRGTGIRRGWLGTALRLAGRDASVLRPLLGHWRRAATGARPGASR